MGWPVQLTPFIFMPLRRRPMPVLYDEHDVKEHSKQDISKHKAGRHDRRGTEARCILYTHPAMGTPERLHSAITRPRATGLILTQVTVLCSGVIFADVTGTLGFWFNVPNQPLLGRVGQGVSLGTRWNRQRRG